MRAQQFGRLGVAGFVVLCFPAVPTAASASPDVGRVDPTSNVAIQQAHLTPTPARAASGATVTAKVSGFKAFEYVNFRWMSPGGPLVAPTVMADSRGRGTRFLTVPSATPGSYTVYAVGLGDGGPTATAKLVVW